MNKSYSNKFRNGPDGDGDMGTGTFLDLVLFLDQSSARLHFTGTLTGTLFSNCTC